MCSFIFSNFYIDNLEYVNFFNKKRGPDLTNRDQIGGLFYVHNLLSITGEKIPQPFKNADESLVSIYNGEIYNYKQLHKNSKSDGQCIIPTYEKEGIKCFKNFDGEYAIILVDNNKKECYIVTDTFSTKPVWYAREGERFCATSYKSVLDRLGFKNPIKITPNSLCVFDLNDFSIKKIYNVKKFDILNQTKESFDDWVSAFENSIKKRSADLREKIFIGLSSGYDSGAIACELIKQNIKFKSYSIKAQETLEILEKRHSILQINNQEVDMTFLTKQQFLDSKKNLKRNAEEFKYQIKRNNAITPNEFMTDDKGAVGMYYICEKAEKEGIKIYFSGQGADEIFSDYGHDGRKIYNHSTIGGRFPRNLNECFPWNNFYNSTQVSYLAKQEGVSGACGIEGRYPFLDFDVVQEFLWLHPDLKNLNYKAPLHEYLIRNKFPFDIEKKIGFSCDRNLRN